MVDWNHIRKEGLPNPISLRLRKQTDVVVKNVQWSEAGWNNVILKDYIRHLGRSNTVIHMLHGFD